VIKETPLSVSFGVNNLDSSGKISLSAKDLTNKAREFLETLKIKNVDYDSPLFTYLSMSDEVSNNNGLKLVNSASEADFLGISLTYNLSGYKLLTNAPNNYPLYLLLDASGKLIQLNIVVSTFVQSSFSMSVIPFAKAVDLLDEKGVVVYAQSNEDKNMMEVPTYNLTSVDLKKVQLSYYMSPGLSTYLYPYYVFQGEAKEEKGKIVEVMVLLPVNPTN
jgi:hypothetical protein